MGKSLKSISLNELMLYGNCSKIFRLERLLWRGWKIHNPFSDTYSIYIYKSHIWVIVYDLTECLYLVVSSDNLFTTYSERDVINYNKKFNDTIGLAMLLKSIETDILSSFKKIVLIECLKSKLE